MERLTWWFGSVPFPVRRELLGKAACTSYAWSSMHYILHIRQSACSIHRSSIRMCSHQVQFACRPWMPRKTGLQPWASVRFCFPFKACWTSQMWIVLLIPSRANYYSKKNIFKIYFIYKCLSFKFQSKPPRVQRTYSWTGNRHGRFGVDEFSRWFTGTSKFQSISVNMSS